MTLKASLPPSFSGQVYEHLALARELVSRELRFLWGTQKEPEKAVWGLAPDGASQLPGPLSDVQKP